MRRAVSFLLMLILLTGLAAARAAGPAEPLSVRFYDEAAGRYGEPAETDRVNLTLNGAALDPVDVPALVQYPEGQNGRTLVPVRLIAEALGAAVTWVPDTRQVILLREDDVIVLTLGSSQALVNGQSAALPDGIPAGVVMWEGKESTMVPLRFVSEQLGAQVTWDNATFTAAVTAAGQTPAPSPAPEPEQPDPSPTPEPAPEPEQTPTLDPGDLGYVTGLSVDGEARTVTIHTNHTPEYRVTDLGDRVAVDLLGAVLAHPADGETSIPAAGEILAGVRCSQHGDDLSYSYPHTFRVVLDLRDGASYAENLTVTAGESWVRVTASQGGEAEEPQQPQQPDLDPDKYTIVLDAGHDGTTLGAVYPDSSGTQIYEKDLTLSMVKKLETILLGQGYNVVLTRDGETAGDLYERCDLANAVEADLFVSIHCNSAPTVPSFQGLYTYHHPGSTRSKNFAQAVQDAACAASGAVDRGMASADFVVLRETNMAAVLVETGFMTNVEELDRLCDESYQQKLMEGVARGIADYLAGLEAQAAGSAA